MPNFLSPNYYVYFDNNIVFVFNNLPPTSVQNKSDLPGPLPNFDSAITVTL